MKLKKFNELIVALIILTVEIFWRINLPLTYINLQPYLFIIEQMI